MTDHEDLWQNPRFLEAALLQQSENHMRRAEEALRVRPVGHQTSVLALARLRQAQRERLAACGVPCLPLRFSVRTDVDARHVIAFDAGLAVCGLGAAAVQRLRQNDDLSLARSSEVGAVLVGAMRLGWDRELDALLRALRPGGAAHAPTLRERVLREPWCITDHPTQWRTLLRDCECYVQQLHATDPPELKVEAITDWSTFSMRGERG